MRRAESNESGAAPRPESIPAGLEWRPGVYEQPQSQGIEATQSEPSAERRHGCLETREPKNWNGVWEWDRVNVQVVLKKAGNFMKVGEGSSWYSASRSTRALVSGPGSILAGRVDWNVG